MLFQLCKLTTFSQKIKIFLIFPDKKEIITLEITLPHSKMGGTATYNIIYIKISMRYGIF